MNMKRKNLDTHIELKVGKDILKMKRKNFNGGYDLKRDKKKYCGYFIFFF